MKRKLLPFIISAAFISANSYASESNVTFKSLVKDNADLPAVQIYKAEKYIESGDYELSLKHYIKALELGLNKVTVNMVNMVNSGVLKGEGLNSAIEQIENEAKERPLLSLFLGDFYEEGRFGFEIDRDKAFKWYNNASSLNNTKAKHKVADYIANKEVAALKVYKEMDAALIYKNIADNNEDHIAAMKLGDILLKGDLVNYDYKMAKKYYEKAYNGGVNQVSYQLAYLYEKGIGVNRDTERAVDLYNEAINYERASDAYYRLGRINLYGADDFIKNTTQGLVYMSDAAKLGNASANYRMGLMSMYGSDNVLVDINKAIEYLKKSSDAGYRLATSKLLEIYRTGHKGVTVEVSEMRDLESKLIKK